jgi:hypothetical protein
MPCSRIQRRRALGDVCALLFGHPQILFFESDVVPLEEPRDRTLAGRNPSLQQFRNDLVQRPVRSFGNQGKDQFGMSSGFSPAR